MKQLVVSMTMTAYFQTHQPEVFRMCDLDPKYSVQPEPKSHSPFKMSGVKMCGNSLNEWQLCETHVIE